VMRMRVLVLGAAAGGGLPQWNCGCSNCIAARTGKLSQQTQSSLAVTSNGLDWTLFNASPDIRSQLTNNRQLWPTDLRKSPLHSLVLTNGDIDHIGGLLTLREKQPFTLFLTEKMNEILNSNPVFHALDPMFVTKHICKLNTWFNINKTARARLFPVPGKVPLFMEEREINTLLLGEQTVGVEYESGGARLLYIPGCAAITSEIETKITKSDILFFDGTLYADNEMIETGLGTKTGARMGHISMSGEVGSLTALHKFTNLRKIYIHMNNTNPVWVPNSIERAHVQSSGWEVGFDGMEIAL
jgi:pyrroloquinoline quinone biosynthesis protein B